MSDELLIRNNNTIDSLYSIIIDNAGGHVIQSSGAIDASPTAAEWSTYAITMSQLGDSQLYRGTIPGSLVSGWYSFIVFIGSSDIGDTQKAEPTLFYWNGTIVIENNITAISGDIVAADNLEATFDGTGYVNDKAPATQNKLDSVGNDTGVVLPITLSSITGKINVVDGVVDDILEDTIEIGTAGAGLIDLGGMADAMKAEVQVQVTASIVAHNLDHLMLTPVVSNSNMTAEVPDGTVLSNILSKASDTSEYDYTTDSLEAMRDRVDARTIDSDDYFDPNNDAAILVAALMSHTGFTAGGTTSYGDLMKYTAAWIAGAVRDKSGTPGVIEFLDIDNGSIVFELDHEQSTPYRTVTII